MFLLQLRTSYRKWGHWLISRTCLWSVQSLKHSYMKDVLPETLGRLNFSFDLTDLSIQFFLSVELIKKYEAYKKTHYFYHGSFYILKNKSLCFSDSSMGNHKDGFKCFFNPKYIIFLNLGFDLLETKKIKRIITGDLVT